MSIITQYSSMEEHLSDETGVIMLLAVSLSCVWLVLVFRLYLSSCKYMHIVLYILSISSEREENPSNYHGIICTSC